MEVKENSASEDVTGASMSSSSHLEKIECERIQVANRIAKNKENYFVMRHKMQSVFNGKPTRELITPLARIISTHLNIPIDRLAQRYSDALICWFAENWSRMSPSYHTISKILTQIYGENITPPERQCGQCLQLNKWDDLDNVAIPDDD